MAASQPDLRIVPLATDHDRDGFSCGVDSLDRYLRTQASQDVRRKANGVFILVELEQPRTVLGYYTLCATGLPQGDVPVAARKHIPRYPLVSATLVGRLAVSTARQGERLGAICSPTPCNAPTHPPRPSVRRCWSLTRSMNAPPPSTKAMGSCAYRIRCGWCSPFTSSRKC